MTQAGISLTQLEFVMRRLLLMDELLLKLGKILPDEQIYRNHHLHFPGKR
ncbi:hypothetical protein EBME_0475 [bacterium endosymbiont of Mortierella elongata FMR23-6]|nr:hypothetical protein EBME_0475 [bacterium endosymbiont of Mortierella elongata FMR23-6]